MRSIKQPLSRDLTLCHGSVFFPPAGPGQGRGQGFSGGDITDRVGSWLTKRVPFRRQPARWAWG